MWRAALVMILMSGCGGSAEQMRACGEACKQNGSAFAHYDALNGCLCQQVKDCK